MYSNIINRAIILISCVGYDNELLFGLNPNFSEHNDLGNEEILKMEIYQLERNCSLLVKT